MLSKEVRLALTFDDVLLVPSESEVLPRSVDLTTRLTRNLKLRIPLLSAAMDTVTEARTAIAMAQAGALELMHKHRIEKLPVVDERFELKGLLTVKDIEKTRAHPNATKDPRGRLLCAAAVGVSADLEERVEALLKAGCDVIVIDTAHGHSKGGVEAVGRP